MRVFLGLTEVSGYYSNLKKGFDRLGIYAEHVSIHVHRFRYDPLASDNSILKFAQFCVSRRVSVPRNALLRRSFASIMTIASRVFLFTWAVLKFDVFVMGGGSSFFRRAELPVLRFLGKRIIYTMHGTDMRPPYVDGIREDVPISSESDRDHLVFDQKSPTDSSKAEDVRYYAQLAKKRKRAARRIEKYAHAVVSPPPVAHFLTRPFVQWLAMGVPTPAAASASRELASGSNVITILHCPSHFAGKGTSSIREAVTNLRQKGYAIRYIEMSGRPNAEVLAAIRLCDFVVDQVYSDVPMAAFAAEAASYGKPAVVGGYYSLFIRHDSREDWIPPSLFCHPDQIQQGIEKLLVDEGFRRELGRRAKKFIEKNWSPEKVAAKYVQLIEGNFPEEWLYHPKQNRYVYGMGLNEANARAIVRGLIERFGRAGLLLAENPDLEERFVQFAYGQASDAAATV